MKIGEIIRRERTKIGLSQEDLAKAIGSTKQAIYKYESGIVSNIPMDKVEIIANRLNVTPAYLMGWSDEGDENPHELRLLTSFEKLDNDDQKVVSEWVESYKKDPTPPITQLSEGERALLELFRQIPEDAQKMYLEVLRASLKNRAED